MTMTMTMIFIYFDINSTINQWKQYTKYSQGDPGMSTGTDGSGPPNDRH